MKLKIINRNMHFSRKGFTLVELVLYMGILTGLLFMITSIFASAIDLQSETIASSSVHEDGSYILNRLQYDITRASSITTPSIAGQQTNTLVLIINGITHTFNGSGASLTLTNTNGTMQLNSYETDLSNVSFTRYGNTNGKHTVKVSFILTGKTRKNTGFETNTFTSTFGLR